MAAFDAAILPGQAGKVTAAVRTESLHAGSIGKGITVTTNDPARPMLALTIRANIVASVDLRPSPILFIQAGQTPDMTGRLLVQKDPTETGDLKVSDLRADAPWLRCTARRIEEADTILGGGLPPGQPGDWLIEAKPASDLPRGQSRTDLRFRTGLPREPEIKVPVTVNVLPEINLSTTRLVLQPMPEGDEVTGVALATVRADLDPGGLAVDAEPAPFHAELVPSGARHFRVNVTWTAKGEDAPRDGRVTLRLGKATAVLTVTVPPAPASPAGASSTGSAR